MTDWLQKEIGSTASDIRFRLGMWASWSAYEPPAPAPKSHQQDIVQEAVAVQAIKAAKKKVSKGFTPRLKVTLRVSNEFEGKTFEIVHEADTLSTLLAEQEATKTARKKFMYVEVISVKSM